MSTENDSKPLATVESADGGDVPDVDSALDNLPARRDGTPDGKTMAFIETMEDRWRLSKMLVASGMLPRDVDEPEKAMTIMLKGHELGLPPMQAFSSIHVIEGRPTLAAQLMMALCIRDADCTFTIGHKSDQGAKVTIHRPGWEPHTETFTIEDAEQANLTGKSNWRNYPEQMCFWRAVSNACRAVCSDLLAGMHTPEEIAPDVPIDPETGGVVEGASTSVKDRTKRNLDDLKSKMEGSDSEAEPDPSGDQDEPEPAPPQDEGAPEGEGEEPDPPSRDEAREQYLSVIRDYAEDASQVNHIRKALREEADGFPDDEREWTAENYVDAAKLLRTTGQDFVAQLLGEDPSQQAMEGVEG